MRASRFVRAAAATLGAGVALALVAGPVGATHKGEKITVSKTTGLADGDTVRVTFSGFAPGGVDGVHPNAKIVVAGQATFNGIPDKLNFDEYASAPEVLVQPDGTGAADYTVYADHGTMQDGTTLNCNTAKCWLIVIQEPFLGPEGQPRYAAQEISFGTAVAPTTAAPVAPTTAAPVETTTIPPAAETTTTAAAAVTTTTVAATTTTEAATEAAGDVTVDDEGGSNTGVIVGVAVAAALVLGGGAFVATRKKPALDDGEAPTDV